MKKFWQILLYTALVILPVAALLIAILAFKVSDIGSLIGGVVSYIGTVVLGFVSLRQNTRLHKLERVSKKTRITFDGSFTYKVDKVKQNFIENTKSVPCNYFLLSDNKDFKGEKLIIFKFPFKIDGYGLKYANLDYVKINEEEDSELELFVDGQVRTEVVYSVKDKTYQIELAIIAAEFNKIKDLIKHNDFTISLFYFLVSSADVKTLYIAKLNLGNFLEEKSENHTYEMNNISYWEINDEKDK